MFPTMSSQSFAKWPVHLCSNTSTQCRITRELEGTQKCFWEPTGTTGNSKELFVCLSFISVRGNRRNSRKPEGTHKFFERDLEGIPGASREVKFCFGIHKNSRKLKGEVFVFFPLSGELEATPGNSTFLHGGIWKEYVGTEGMFWDPKELGETQRNPSFF